MFGESRERNRGAALGLENFIDETAAAVEEAGGGGGGAVGEIGGIGKTPEEISTNATNRYQYYQ